MSDTLKAKLHRAFEKGKPGPWRVTFFSKKGTSQTLPPDAGTLAPDLVNASENEIEVDLELVKGRPANIRRAGTLWVTPQAAAPARDHVKAAGRGGNRGGISAARVGHFHNPYNFIPAVEPTVGGPLGRHAPIGHKAWFPDHFNGRITVDIEAKTPLLVPDASRASKKKNGHTTLPPLTESDGKTPKLPPTSFKGALRSTFEAITNSRFAIFQGHDAPLGRRMEASEGLAMVPARLSEDGRIELWMGTLAPRNDVEFHKNRPQADRRPPGNVMYAAWLRRYHRGGTSARGPAYDTKNAVRYPDGSYPRHGDAVVCLLRRYRKVDQSGKTRFSYWRVEVIRREHDFSALSSPAALGASTRLGNFHELVSEAPIRAWGYVSVTNQNIGNKHDERVFFVPETENPYRPGVARSDLESWRSEWAYLVADYKEKAKKIINRRTGDRVDLDTYQGRDIGKTALSRHICDSRAAKLEAGDLCFARIGANGSITGLFPVMISREVAQIAPVDLLPEGLRPATSISALSPADRVFGWVDQAGGTGTKGKRRAYRGQLRITSLRFLDCKDQYGNAREPITFFGGNGLPLAILSTPKPEQARFYLAKDKMGSPQDSNIHRASATYDYGMVGKGVSQKGLRGRKVYPHHRDLPDDYWNGPEALFTAEETPAIGQWVGHRFLEYVRLAPNLESLRDDQNHSIEGWVNPGARFRAKIDVMNLSRVELGALLYLLTLPIDHFLRLGGGKPLGFGSVHVEVVDLDLVDGDSIREELLSILPSSRSETKGFRLNSMTKALDVVKAYQSAMIAAYGNNQQGFEKIPIVKAFLAAACGFVGRPIHYPRLTRAPSPDGKNFEWFVANESRDGPRQSLDSLWEAVGLDLLRDPGKEETPAPRAPREKAVTTRSRHDDEIMNKPYLANLLRQGPASVEDLFERAQLPVVDFYKQLAWEFEKDHVQDDDGKLKAK